MKSYAPFLVLSVLFVAGCSSLKHLEADVFLARAEQISETQSAKWTTYIGASGQRVYLEQGDLASSGAVLGFGPKVMVYWTELDGLPQEVVLAIRSGQNPWVNSSKKEPEK